MVEEEIEELLSDEEDAMEEKKKRKCSDTKLRFVIGCSHTPNGCG